MILTALTGCDNVAWGGIDVRLEPPPPRAELAAEAPGLAATLEGTAEPLPELPTGPLLAAGSRSGAEATLWVVGEVRGERLGELPDEASAPGFLAHLSAELLAGSRWTLFAEGVRVGSMTADSVGVDARFCVPRPTVRGVVELVPTASAAIRLMALPEASTAAWEYRAFASHQHDYDQRVASLAFATSEIPRVGATWPPDGILSARQDIQAFQLVDDDTELIAATFVHADRVATAPPRAGAYSLFVMGADQPSFVWYRPADTEGKGVPRYFGHLDWDRDGEEEVLLDIFGAESRWFASVERRNGAWERAHEDACGRTVTGAE